MTEPNTTEPIPYASVAHRGLTARDVFGIVVRSLGLLVGLYGLYCLFYLASAIIIGGPSGSYPRGTYLFVGAAYLVVAVAMVKGEWIVDMAYGPAQR